MAFPRIHKFCGCFDLLLGGKILGLYGFLMGIGYVFLTIGVLRDIDHFEHRQKEHEFFNDNHDAIYGIFIANAVVGTFLFLTSLSMLYGSTKQNSKFVFPFLIGLIVSAIWSFMFFTIEIIDTSYLEAFYLFVLGGFQVYFWLCAYSFFQDLHDAETVVITQTFV